MLVTAVALHFTNLNIISIDSKKKCEKIIVKKQKKYWQVTYVRIIIEIPTCRTTRGYLNILIVMGDFGGGVKFFEKIFAEIFVFHI